MLRKCTGVGQLSLTTAGARSMLARSFCQWSL